jgi:UDP-glucose 4-epimerase
VSDTSRVLVTGGAGFIGSHLVDRLVAAGRAVTVLDNFSSGRPENLAEASASGDVRVIEGTILSRDDLRRALEGCGEVHHLAVECVRRSLAEPIGNHDVNATGTLLTLEEARRQGVRRFTYCSSSEVYGNCGTEWMTEDTTVCAPVTVYGAAKLAGEHYAKVYWQTYGMPTIVVRPFNTYGPRAHESGKLAEVIPRFTIRVLNGLPPVIFGSGDNGRDFTYVTDTTRGIVMASTTDPLIGRSVNIAWGRMVTVAEVARTIAEACGRPDLKAVHDDARPGDVMTLRADTKLASDVLGFRPEIDFESGITRYIDWFRARHTDAAALLEDDVRNW